MRRTALTMFAGVLVLAGVALAHPAGATAWLGVYSQEITPELRDGMSYNGAGALVTRVVTDSPAERAGIQRGDVIVSVGAKETDSPQELADVVADLPSGKPVDVMVVRDGSKKSIRVTLESRPESGEEPEAREAPEAPRTPAPDAERHMGRHMHDGGRDLTIHIPDVPDLGGLGMMSRGRLGVRIETLNPDLASYFGPRDAKGVLVLDVTDDSPAAKAGVRAGDVITKLDDKTVESAEDLVEAVRSSEGSVSIGLLRHGSRQIVKADLGRMSRGMRFESDPDSGGHSGRAHVYRYQGPDGRQRVERIIVPGDGDDNDDGLVFRRDLSADRESMESLREEMKQLREQLEQLRKEMQSNPNR